MTWGKPTFSPLITEWVCLHVVGSLKETEKLGLQSAWVFSGGSFTHSFIFPSVYLPNKDLWGCNSPQKEGIGCLFKGFVKCTTGCILEDLRYNWKKKGIPHHYYCYYLSLYVYVCVPDVYGHACHGMSVEVRRNLRGVSFSLFFFVWVPWIELRLMGQTPLPGKPSHHAWTRRSWTH